MPEQHRQKVPAPFVYKPASGMPASGMPASGMPASGRPAEPFPVIHGASSPRVYGALAQQILAGILERRPDLAGFPEATAAVARAEARAALLSKWLDEQGVDGMVDGDDEVRSLRIRTLASLEREAEARRRAVGLDPASEAALAKSRAEATRETFDLGALLEAGREGLLERRRAYQEQRALEAADEIVVEIVED